MRIKRITFVGCCLLLSISALLASCSNHSKDAIQQTDTPAISYNVENSLYAAYQEEAADEQKVNDIMLQIANVDWKVYGELRNSEYPLVIETLEYLYNHLALIKPEHYSNLVLATTNLDGAASEQYAAIVGELFLNHKSEFLDTLTGMTDKKQRSSIISKIAYNLSYKDPKEIKQEITVWQTRSKYNSKENEVIAEIIEAVENPY